VGLERGVWVCEVCMMIVTLCVSESCSGHADRRRVGRRKGQMYIRESVGTCFRIYGTFYSAIHFIFLLLLNTSNTFDL
ncbi:hypothetical protein CR197_15220, partial [Enterococcus faecium]